MFWRKWFPAFSYFSEQEEQAFRLKLFERTRIGTVRICWLMILVVFSFIFLDMMSREGTMLPILSVRIVMIAFLVAVIAFISYSDIRHHYTVWNWISAIYPILNLVMYHQFIMFHGRLGEGGPMLSALLFGAIPALHLGQKLAVWLVMGLGFIGFALSMEVEIFWSLIFYALTVCSMIMMQYQHDRLLRHNYRAEVAEREKAKMDELTGLYNRRGLEYRVNEILTELKSNERLALGIADVDYFKRYNDHYGHLQGDVALQFVASKLTQFDVDMVVRFGGEEFILIKRYTAGEPDWLTEGCHRFAQQAFEHTGSPLGILTVSIGSVVIDSHQACLADASKLLALADQNLYQAKVDGRNRQVKETLLRS